MRSRSIFGKHLYGQIVYPLLIASVIVGIVATVVAVYFLRDLTTTWVAEVARASTEDLAYRYQEYAGQAQRMTRLAAVDDGLTEAVAAGDETATLSAVVAMNTTLGFDSLMVVDADGTVIAAHGRRAPAPGESVMEPDQFKSKVRVGTGLAQMAGTEALSIAQPLSGPDGSKLFLIAATAVDDRFLNFLGANENASYCFYLANGTQIACTVGTEFSAEDAAALRESLMHPTPGVLSAIAEAREGEFGTGSLRAGGRDYQVYAQRVRWLDDSVGNPFGFVVGAVSQDVSAQAASTTTRLIVMWSVIAVVALVGLGGWVARSVSDPLVELASGARRVAEGDFSTHVPVTGSNEIAELAESFNQMSDSLKERSESLTKKVLELATLYEMSRALGSTLDLDELLGSVLDSALRIFDLDLGYVALRDRDTGVLEIHAIRGAAAHGADGAVRSSMSDWVLREGRPLIFNPDASGSSDRVDTLTGARAALCVPLIAPEGTIGTIAIGSSDAGYRFNADDVRLLSTIANHVTIAIGNIELFTSLQEAYLATVRSLAAAVDAKDTYTRGHSERVATYATAIAEKLGLGHEQRIALEMAAYLHDIGKIGVREDILLKPGKLDDLEMAQMRHHPLIGANILKPVAFPWAITPVVRHHHEHYDGTGYPAGLRGEEIPLLARILTVADSYEAMTSDRPYRKGRSIDEALTELERCKGTQFDPRIVEAFSIIVSETDDEGALRTVEADTEVGPEEVRAIFSALIDGVFASFRRLGGPKLAANVEAELDEHLAEAHTPFRVVRGHIAFTEDPPEVPDGEIEQMREALRRMDAIMGRMSGTGLVDHFYVEALSNMSARMSALATELDFYIGQ